MKSEIIKQDGTRLEIEPKNSKNFKLKEIYELIGCSLIELITLNDGRIMVIDEEGKFNAAKQKNKIATDLFQDGRVENDDFIVGDVLVTYNKMLK